MPPPARCGSVSRVVYELALELAGELDVTVCSLPNPDVPEGISEGIRFLRVEGERDRRRHDYYKEVIRVLRRLDLPHRELQGMPFYAQHYATDGLRRLMQYDPDVLHFQNVSQYLSLAARLFPGPRRVLHMHCDWLSQLHPRTARRRLRHADLILGVSDYITNRIRQTYPELANRCRTLYNGVNLDRFALPEDQPARLRELSAELKDRWRLGDGPVVLYVGGLAPEKGIHTLLPAFRQQLRRTPDAKLVLVGMHNRYFQVVAPRGRKARQELRTRQRGYPQQVAALAEPLGDRVLFVDSVDHNDLAAAYALADVLVMPSTGNEPCPLPVFEALACGVPIVATALGGLPELVSDGVNGRIVPGGDETALADALAELCLDASLARELGAAGRRIVTERFTWRAQAEVLSGYYSELADAEQRGAVRAL